eukprot:1398384-Rhodomonas_salina.1
MDTFGLGKQGVKCGQIVRNDLQVVHSVTPRLAWMRTPGNTVVGLSCETLHFTNLHSTTTQAAPPNSGETVPQTSQPP